MAKTQNSKRYDLEDRTFEFATRVRKFARSLNKDIANFDDCKQLIRSSGSVGANYIEANEALSKKDFVMRTKICRKEAKESRYWLRLIDSFCCGRRIISIMLFRTLAKTCFWAEILDSRFRGNDKKSLPQQELDTNNNVELEREKVVLENEARELTHIFGSIVTKSS